MPINYPATSSRKSLLYSYHKALDQVQELGFVPLRLFRVLYPVWRVQVDGRQRIATDFDELEWYMARGLEEADFHSVSELASFFGVEIDFVQHLINFLRGIGHVVGDDDHLSLTDLGKASIRDRVRYEDQRTSTELYFDALGNIPLTPEHYKIPLIEALPEKTHYQAFYHFDHIWNPNTLDPLVKTPDKKRFNLPDEITDTQVIDRKPAYLPAYLIEAQEKSKSHSSPKLLVFSQVRGLHDTVLEDAVNQNLIVYRALKTRTDSRSGAVSRYFEKIGLKKDSWFLNENGPWGAQVELDMQVFLPEPEKLDEEENIGLAVRSVGRYILIYDWCIWVVCDDVNIRKQAAMEQLAEWLQGINVKPSPQEINQKFASLCQRLDLQRLPLDAVLELARRKGFARAAERIEEMNDL
jgi:hypothetical protein